jgi:hypothetical protein
MVLDRRGKEEAVRSSLEHSNTLSDTLMEYESNSIDSSDFTNHHQKEFSKGGALELSGSNHRNDGKIVSEGGASLMGHTGVVHEHDVGLEEHSSPAKALLLLLLGLHLIGVLIWLRFWLKDRTIKFPRMKNTPPPQKQSCTYDIDSRYISKIELPLKALKIAK